jgi:hypothetical protein
MIWAPLPPEGHDDVNINININTIPDYYWVAVPQQRFLEPNLAINIVIGDRQRHDVFVRSRPAGNVKIVNNIVVNNVINVTEVERVTKKKVTRLKVEKTNNPGDAKVGKDEVTVFQDNVEANKNDKPAKIESLEILPRSFTQNCSPLAMKTQFVSLHQCRNQAPSDQVE